MSSAAASSETRHPSPTPHDETPSEALPPPMRMPSLDGRRFVMTASTTSAVDPDSPSEFTYFERDGVIWGDYWGDTVTFGRHVGVREGDVIRLSFVHVLAADGTVVRGEGESTIERGEDGRLELAERYEMHGAPQESRCVEVLPAP